MQAKFKKYIFRSIRQYHVGVAFSFLLLSISLWRMVVPNLDLLKFSAYLLISILVLPPIIFFIVALTKTRTKIDNKFSHIPIDQVIKIYRKKKFVFLPEFSIIMLAMVVGAIFELDEELINPSSIVLAIYLIIWIIFISMDFLYLAKLKKLKYDPMEPLFTSEEEQSFNGPKSSTPYKYKKKFTLPSLQNLADFTYPKSKKQWILWFFIYLLALVINTLIIAIFEVFTQDLPFLLVSSIFLVTPFLMYLNQHLKRQWLIPLAFFIDPLSKFLVILGIYLAVLYTSNLTTIIILIITIFLTLFPFFLSEEQLTCFSKWFQSSKISKNFPWILLGLFSITFMISIRLFAESGLFGTRSDYLLKTTMINSSLICFLGLGWYFISLFAIKRAKIIGTIKENK